ncbi:MAG: hypothetical protein ACXWLH_02570 [Candidatus Saccharimonadales bacterium]
MTKAKSKQLYANLIFWTLISVFLIWVGISGFQDVAKNRQLNDWTLWIFPSIYMVLGGMILGVAVNKMYGLVRGKSGKK